MPAQVTSVGIALRVNQRLETHVVETVWFKQVYYVESVLDVLASISYTKEIPLCVPICVVISGKD